MQMTPGTVVVKRDGFFTAIVKGVFGVVVVLIICGTALGLFGIAKLDQNFKLAAAGVLQILPEWQKSLPPAIADALSDKRVPEYRKSVEIETKLVAAETNATGEDEDTEDRPVRRHRHDVQPPATIVMTVTNNGEETVSILALRVLAVDERGVPRWNESVYAATPVVLDCDWTGPLLPGATKTLAFCVWGEGAADWKPAVEVSEIRISVPREPADVPEAKPAVAAADCLAPEPPKAAKSPRLAASAEEGD
jgi:hypothetical protein